MKFGQEIEYNRGNVFLQKILKETRQVGSSAVPDFLLFKKVLYEVKASDLQLSFNMFDSPQPGAP